MSYLGNDFEEWNPRKVFEEASFLHFSDWPVPKPWRQNKGLMEEHQPKCVGEDCSARELWWGFYSDFEKRRKDCELRLVVGFVVMLIAS